MILGSIVLLLLVIGGITLYRTYALYEEEKSFNVIQGKVPVFVENDITLAMTVDGEATNQVPSKGNYYVEVICDNNATGEWDYDNWTVVIGNLVNTKVKCSLEFKSPGTLMATSRTETAAFWQYKKDITNVVFENRLNPKSNAQYTFDVSAAGDGSVMSYMVPNENDLTTYVLYIQGNGGIKTGSNASYIFSDFINTESIEGLEYLDTSNATRFEGLFQNCQKLKTIDVSSFNTSKVTNMYEVFSYNYALESIKGLENWDTSKVTYMRAMFYLDQTLQELNLSSFDTTNVTNMDLLVYDCRSLKNLDLSNFSVDKVTSYEKVFWGMPKDSKIKTNKKMQEWILSLDSTNFGRPSAWNEDNFIS